MRRCYLGRRLEQIAAAQTMVVAVRLLMGKPGSHAARGPGTAGLCGEPPPRPGPREAEFRAFRTNSPLFSTGPFSQSGFGQPHLSGPV